MSSPQKSKFIMLQKWSELMSDLKLRPCPFCGSNKIQFRMLEHAITHFVFCTDCRTQGDIYKTQQNAAFKWNYRAGEQEKPQQETNDITLDIINDKLERIAKKIDGLK